MRSETMSMTRKIYLVLTIIGTVLPLFFFNRWFGEAGYSLISLFRAWLSNGAVTGLFVDMLISALTLTVFILVEVKTRKDTLCLIAIPATFCIGVSCGFPLYLFLRSRQIG